MLNNHRPTLGFLYGLLFTSFVGMALGQPVGSWISTTYGGWVTVEAIAAYGVYLLGLIWLINRINKAVGLEPPPSERMSEMEMAFIRRQRRSTEQSDGHAVEPPPEDGNGPTLKY